MYGLNENVDDVIIDKLFSKNLKDLIVFRFCL